MKFTRQYKIKIILIVLILSACILAMYISTPRPKFERKPPKIDPEALYQVANVLDGDTFEIKIGKVVETVRMLGINTPETVDPRKLVQCYGKEASDKTKEMLLKRKVKLEIDTSQHATDKFGRLLAYVHRDDGIFVNKFLLENGFAREYTYSKAYSLQKQFRELEATAKQAKAGLWKKCQ